VFVDICVATVTLKSYYSFMCTIVLIFYVPYW